jgi:hypothetical protein
VKEVALSWMEKRLKVERVAVNSEIFSYLGFNSGVEGFSWMDGLVSGEESLLFWILLGKD